MKILKKKKAWMQLIQIFNYQDVIKTRDIHFNTLFY